MWAWERAGSLPPLWYHAPLALTVRTDDERVEGFAEGMIDRWYEIIAARDRSLEKERQGVGLRFFDQQFRGG